MLIVPKKYVIRHKGNLSPLYFVTHTIRRVFVKIKYWMGLAMGQDKHDQLELIFAEMREIQNHFELVHGVNDIWSNSKIYEVLQANTFQHKMIPGHSGSLDAKDEFDREFEYKHFKETSSNHSWTFNDYSDVTIQKLRDRVHSVIFTHIDDLVYPPRVDWVYEASGEQTANYLQEFTKNLQNARKMINLSALQLETRIGLVPQKFDVNLSAGPYGAELKRIFELISRLEIIVGVSNILTSNKFWEVLVSLPLGHTVNSEQGGRAGAHDAFDDQGGDYEYKVSSTRSWNFQDISEAVLDKYLNCEEIVLAIVDKPGIRVKEIWTAKPEMVVKRLREKLAKKALEYSAKDKEIRRQQVSVSAGDVEVIGAVRVF